MDKDRKDWQSKSIGHKGLKICFVGCFPPSRGRLAEYSYYVTNELQSFPQIGRIDVIADGKEYCTEAINDRITLHRVWEVNNPTSLLSIPLRILRLKPDVVHFNVHMAVFGTSKLANFVGLSLPFICRLMGFKTLVTLHNITERIDVEKAGFRNTFLNNLGAFVATKFLTLASAVTVTVRSYVEILKNKYKCKRVLWIPHGTWDVEPTHCVKHHNPNTILYMGHSGPYKDLDLLFQAFEILNQRRGDIGLMVAGESHPNYPNFLSKYKGENNSSSTQFRGYVPDDKLQNLFDEADVVVLPYHTCTGTSGVAHLASSYGIPIIATDLPEFRELTEEGCGIVLSRHNSEALAEKIEELLNDADLRHKLIEQNLSFARERTWNKIVSSFCTVYETMLL